ncbi:MAG: DUF1549 and DUF1553 domain-containing protein [Bacteroidales bacterium]|nr:DUF1549 and DUF1553 domain-containing protein [Bacteroidales bacterium]
MRRNRVLPIAALLVAVLLLAQTTETVAQTPKQVQQFKQKLRQQEVRKKLRELQKAKEAARKAKAQANEKTKAAEKAKAQANEKTKAAEKAKKKPTPEPESTPAPTALTFQPQVPAELTAIPEAQDAAAFAKRIDDQIDAALRNENITPSPICNDEEFLRRVYLDITGVIPTLEQTRKFLDSTDPQKRSLLIDELLADPHYGRHLADQWIPKLYPKESNNRFVLKEPLYNWFQNQFNQNTRWDQFVFDLVTATGTVEDNPAVTYYLANRSVDKLTDTVTQHFLGIQLQCAQCHNHPFTGWKQQEYWGMAAFFSRVVPQNPRNANRGGDNMKIGVTEGTTRTKLRDFFPEATMDVAAKFLGGPEPKIAPREPQRPVLASWMVAGDNPYFARAMVNRTWAQLFGRGFVNPIDDMHPDNPPSHPELLSDMARIFAGSGFDVKFLTKAICLTNTYQRSSRPTAGNENDDIYFSHMTMKVMIPEQLFDSVTRVAGPTLEAVAKNRQEKAQAGKRRPGNGARDQFVTFFLAGSEAASTTEYEAGIPQALRMMNSRLAGSPALARNIAGAFSKPETAIENLYLTTLSRRPTEAETARLTGYITQADNANTAYSDILWALVNSSEFTMVR